MNNFDSAFHVLKTEIRFCQKTIDSLIMHLNDEDWEHADYMDKMQDLKLSLGFCEGATQDIERS